MNNLAIILKNTDIFYKFTDSQLEIVSSLCEERKFGMGEILFLEGSKCDELYIIADGIIDIMVNPELVSDKPSKNHKPYTIAKLRRGQSFGEIALVDQGLRSATARCAQENTKLLIIPSRKLMALCEKYPELGYRLMFNLAVDLALKIRSTGLLIREELLYGRP